MYAPSNAEREVIIRWNVLDKVAMIFADDPVVIRKLDKLCAECPDTYRCTHEGDDYGGRRYEVAAKYVRFGRPPTEAQREWGRKLNQRRLQEADFH